MLSKLVDNSRRSFERGRFGPNFVTSVGYFALSTLIGLWFTPYLIRQLGPGAYGLVPLATTVAGYMSIITLSLNAAVGRMLTVAAETGNELRANRVFNTSLFGSFLLVLLLAVPGTWFSFRVDRFLDVPSGEQLTVRWLFLCTMVAFLLNTVKTPFEVSTFYRNRFDLRNVLSAGENITRVAVVVLFFGLVTPSVVHVGLGILGATIVSCIGAIGLWRLLTPELHVSLWRFDRNMLGEMLATGGWVSLNTVGSILFLGVDLFVINRLLGATASGRYAVVLQWSTLLRGIATTISGVFGPTMVYHWAKQDVVGLLKYAVQSVKFVGLVMALPIGLVSGLSSALLHAWLGPEFASEAGLMTLVTIHLCVNLAVLPLLSLQTATNHVKWPGLLTLILGAVNLGLALLLAGPVGLGVYGVAIAGAITLSCKNWLFTPLYTHYVLGQGKRSLYRAMVPAIAATLTITTTGRLLLNVWEVTTWLGLFVLGAGITLVYAICVYFFLLSDNERLAIRRLIPLPKPEGGV